MNVLFTDRAWSHYLYWQETDPKMVRKINALIKECQRTPFAGSGKPEPLKLNLKGFWSRRIDQEHRLVYQVEGDELRIAQCRFHYD